MIAAFFAMLFMTAPLLCIRFCQLKHAAWRAADAAALAESHAHPEVGHPPQRRDAPPFDDVLQMLRSIVEFLPSMVAAASSIVLHTVFDVVETMTIDRRFPPLLRPPITPDAFFRSR